MAHQWMRLLFSGGRGKLKAAQWDLPRLTFVAHTGKEGSKGRSLPDKAAFSRAS